MIWDLDRADDIIDLIQSLEMGREPSMHAHDLLVDDGTYRHAIETV